ncbi:hypothetical protein ACF08O_31765 [Streptomyces paradoxus]|uniref:hypothetical protein n=1 Tax=Streptomyces paradoxus TaxID=66375 RepID=UPI003702120C
MASMTPPALAESRPPLPIRPTPHERDGRQGGSDAGRPHPQQVTSGPARVEREIGPREPGAIYKNVDGAFEVLEVTRDPERARTLLGRGSAQWALIVKDVLRQGAEPFVVGSIWTTSDHVIRPASRAEAALAPAA